MMHVLSRLLGLALSFVALATPTLADDVAKLPLPVDRKVDYAKDVQPIFAAACYSCHGPKKQESSFRLDRKADAFKGGEIGKPIVVGKSADSPLIKYVSGVDK